MDHFKTEHVLGDVIDELPGELLEVHWAHVNARHGNVVTPTQIKDEPRVHWDADPDSYYTLIMTDPDAPSREHPKMREWHHWLVVNIPGSKVSEGEVQSAYIGAGPPPGTGLHRYVFLVFQQKKKQDFNLTHIPNTSGKHREKFNTRSFVRHHHLGPLVAANFVQAEWDEYVPHIHKQLGF